MVMDDADLRHLRRCIQLAALAVAGGDEPYGSVLVGFDGTVLAERHNQVHTTRDVTAHPELALAAWSSRNLTPEQRADATMYTSSEHCAMCAAAHVKAGIGRLVYVLSAPMTDRLSGPGTRINLRAADVVAASTVDIMVEGPCEELVESASAVFGPSTGS